MINTILLNPKSALFALACLSLTACDSGVNVNSETTPGTPVVVSSNNLTAQIDATPAFLQRGCGTSIENPVHCPD